ncbi:dipeptidase [Altererythrobacter sp. MF3-039]|uniref:dipeptidase n=1 Tax=Altererythrobacter sp. MF3-039 TaxID=3252901 RepID=UPI00390C95F0
MRQLITTLVAGALLAGCSYSDRPQAASAPAASVEAVHERALVLDAHADIVIPGVPNPYVGPDGLSKIHPSKLAAGKVDAVVMAVAVPPGPRTDEGDAAARAEADLKLATILDLADSSDALAIARTADDVQSIAASGQTAVIIGFQNARALQGEIANIDRFYVSGVRVFGLNHIGHNEFADSSRPVFDGETFTYEPDEEHGGLSALGFAAIQRINALGGIIDVSQSSKATTLQAIDLSTAPVIATHSNARGLSDVSRNLSDEELDALAAKGGVINIAVFAAYLVDYSDEALLGAIRNLRQATGLPEEYSYPYELYWEIDDLEKRGAFLMAMRDIIGTGSVELLVDHVDYVAQRIGIDHVGIGSDFNHGGGIDGFTDASEASNVTAELIKRGYSADDIAKIWGGNFLRVMRAAEAGAAR